MSREDFVAIASRLFSAYMLFQIVQALPNIALTIAQYGEGWWFTSLYALAAIVAIALCAVLWFFPLTVARKLLPVMREPRSEQQIDASIAMSIGLVLLGVWFFANAVTDAVYWLSLFFVSRRVADAGFTWAPDQIASMVATVAEAILALWLLFGNAGIKRLVYQFRYGDS